MPTPRNFIILVTLTISPYLFAISAEKILWNHFISPLLRLVAINDNAISLQIILRKKYTDLKTVARISTTETIVGGSDDEKGFIIIDKKDWHAYKSEEQVMSLLKDEKNQEHLTSCLNKLISYLAQEKKRFKAQERRLSRNS